MQTVFWGITIFFNCPLLPCKRNKLTKDHHLKMGMADLPLNSFLISSIKTLLLGTKCVFQHQDMQMFGLKVSKCELLFPA